MENSKNRFITPEIIIIITNQDDIIITSDRLPKDYIDDENE